MSKKKWIIGAFVVVSLIAGGIALAVNPDITTTRFDNPGQGSWGITGAVPAAGDSIKWIGWEAYSGTVVRMNANIEVTPILNPSKTITNGNGPPWSSRSVDNPRDGAKLYQWGPDTLTTTNTRLEYCCGALLGFRIRGVGTAAYYKLYATGQQ